MFVAYLAEFRFSFLGRLGLIICEDLLWYYPTVDLVASHGVDTIIFPTEWWDEYPHQLPHVDQASWAKALQVRYIYSGGWNINIRLDVITSMKIS